MPAFKASHRHAQISPRKVRPLADLVRGEYASDALDILRYPEQTRGQRVNIDQLVIAEARIDGGPMFKRIRPRARGMAFMIKKRMSHIHVVLSDEVE